MFSVEARSKLLERGWSFSSLMKFFVDSGDESIRYLRSNRDLAVSILKFSSLFHVVTLALLSLVYVRGDLSSYPRLVFFAVLSYLGFTFWVSMYIRLIRDRGGRMRRSVGLANYLTLSRFFLIVPLVVLYSHGHWIAALAVYVVLGLTDVADGIVARARSEQTEFGVVMDPLADVFSTAAVFAVFLSMDLVPLWLFIILMVRYGTLILGSFVLFLVVGPIQFRATLPGKIVGVLQAVGIIIIIGCTWRGIDWERNVAPVLFPCLGFFFSIIVVSQLTLGYRHVRRRAKLRSQAV